MDSHSDVKRKVIEFARSAFRSSPVPTFLDRDCDSVECIQKALGYDFFIELNNLMYHLEDEEIKFFVPYAMEYHLFTSSESDAEWHLEHWLMFWTSFDYSTPQIEKRFRSCYASLNRSQRTSICMFLKLARDLRLVEMESELTRGIEYWCTQR